MARLSVPLIGMLVLSMAATAAPPPAMASARHSATGNAAASCVTEATNLATARRCGVRVENLAARTERAQIFANPSGTQTFEATALPSRVKRPDGTWAAVDPTLREAGGAIRPVATTATVKFSRGGTEPLATVGEGAQSWTLSWPQPLPRPRLEGEKAIYANVFPGIDLVMRARVDGFTHVLVVHDAVAAANPALREVRYLTSGKEMMTRAAALMWDSTPGGLASSAAEPGDGAQRAEIPVRVEGNDFYLVPNQKCFMTRRLFIRSTSILPSTKGSATGPTPATTIRTTATAGRGWAGTRGGVPFTARTSTSTSATSPAVT